MANFRLTNACGNALLNTIRDRIDAADKPGTITFFAGKQPISSNKPVGASLRVGVLTFAKQCAPDAVSGDLAFNPIAECRSAEITTTDLAWARIADGDGNTVFDCDVSDERGNGVIKINSTDIKAGGPIRIAGFALKYPTA